MNKLNWVQRLAVKAASYAGVSFDTMNHDMVRNTFGGAGSTAGKMVNDGASRTLSSAFACQRVITEAVGTVPWGMYERRGEDRVAVPDYELAGVLVVSPNPDMTSVEFKEALTLNLCQHGNCYSFIERASDGAVISLRPIDSTLVQTKVHRETGAVYYAVNDRGRTEDVPREKIWHVKGFGPNGIAGLSVIGAAREAMGFALATEEFGARFFAQGGKPSGIATIPNFLTKQQREVARENLQQMLGGMGNAHKFALFEGGIKPEPWGDMPLQDMEFLLLRKFSVQEVCRFYRVPPHMIADLERATFSNIEHQDLEFVKYALMPYFTRIEASAAKWLLKPADRVKYFLRFNFEALLRADSKGRAEFYASALMNGWMNRNEVRAKENLNAVTDVPGMDAYTVQGAMVNIDALPDEVTTAPTPTAFAAPSKSGDVIVLNGAQTSGGQPQAPAINVGGNSASFTLSDGIGDSIAEAVRSALATSNDETKAALLAAVAEVARVAKESADRTERLIRDNSEVVSDAAVMAFERNEKAMDELSRVLRLPRKAVFDNNNEPIGTVVVERLH